MKQLQAMKQEAYDMATTKISGHLIEFYPLIPELKCYDTDAINAFMKILEQYDSAQSHLNIQGTIQQYIRDYGERSNDSPAQFANTIHDHLHMAYRLQQSIDSVAIFAVLDRHFKKNTKIDPVIRHNVISIVQNPDVSLTDVLRNLRQLSILHACPDSTPDAMFVAKTTTTPPSTSTALSPGALHHRQREAQQGLRTASQPQTAARSEDKPRQEDKTSAASPKQFEFCYEYLRTGTCSRGKDCRRLHVSNSDALYQQGFQLPKSQSGSGQAAQYQNRPNISRGGHNPQQRREDAPHLRQGPGDNRNMVFHDRPAQRMANYQQR